VALPRIDPPSKQSPFVILSEAPGLNFLCEIDGRGAEGSMHFLIFVSALAITKPKDYIPQALQFSFAYQIHRSFDSAHYRFRGLIVHQALRSG
jgi:hypothetical protein